MRRTLVASEFNAKDRAHFAQAYEFCRIVAECEDCDLVAPGIDNYLMRYLRGALPAHDSHNVQRDFNRLVNGIRKRLGLKNAPTMEHVRLTQDYDLFFFVAWSPQSLVELHRIHDWRGRSTVAVAYLFELWTSTLERDSQYLKLLDEFDHVFLLHSACISRLPRYTSTPCSFMATGVDCLTWTPLLSPAERVVDVYSIGNRSARIHGQLLKLAEERDFLYLYDTLASTDSRVKNWREHRLLLANIIRRTRFFMAFSPATLGDSKPVVAGEQVLPTRLFEGAAGGAVIVGTPPRCADFNEHFDWPDAVIEVCPDSGSIAEVIDALDAQPRRMELLRRTNAVRCLERHDWAYRWQQILSTIGMEPLPQFHLRTTRLQQIAADSMALV